MKSLNRALAIVLLFSSTLSFAAEFDSQIPALEWWTATMANVVNRHFGKPYKLDLGLFGLPSSNVKHKKIVDEGTGQLKKYTVYRIKHGLAHGVRQGFLALDIVNLLEESWDTHNSFSCESSNEFMIWVKNKTSRDQYFRHKLFAAAVFQRTGRESEASSSSNPKLYFKYERSDVKNFLEYFGGPGLKFHLFSSKTEMDLYADAIRWSTESETKTQQYSPDQLIELKYLRKILHASHTLDLRRLPHFDPKRIFASVASDLFGEKTIDKHSWEIVELYKREGEFVATLWERSGTYLKVTGDRDVVENRTEFGDDFFVLQNFPPQLAINLLKAQKQ